jgi:hypothetical protein
VVHVPGVGPRLGLTTDRQANANVHRRALELPASGGAVPTGLLLHIRSGGQWVCPRRPGVLATASSANFWTSSSRWRAANRSCLAVGGKVIITAPCIFRMETH